jgi:hypothetical protein
MLIGQWQVTANVMASKSVVMQGCWLQVQVLKSATGCISAWDNRGIMSWIGHVATIV